MPFSENAAQKPQNQRLKAVFNTKTRNCHLIHLELLATYH